MLTVARRRFSRRSPANAGTASGSDVDTSGTAGNKKSFRPCRAKAQGFAVPPTFARPRSEPLPPAPHAPHQACSRTRELTAPLRPTAASAGCGYSRNVAPFPATARRWLSTDLRHHLSTLGGSLAAGFRPASLLVIAFRTMVYTGILPPSSACVNRLASLPGARTSRPQAASPRQAALALAREPCRPQRPGA